MNQKSKYWAVSMAMLGFVACAQTQIEKDVESQASAQPSRQMHGGVASKGMDSIESSKNLSEEQKQKLRELQARMMQETFKNQEETSKLKGVLFETITSGPYNPSKVNVIKKRLIQLNTQKLDNMFGALAEVEKIVGYASRNEKADYYGEVMREVFRVDK